jgi:hypothetical protein
MTRGKTGLCVISRAGPRLIYALAMIITEPTPVTSRGQGGQGSRETERGSRGEASAGGVSLGHGGLSQSKSDGRVSKGDTRVRVTVLLSVAHFRGYLLLQEIDRSEAHCVFLWNEYWFRSLRSRV